MTDSKENSPTGAELIQEALKTNEGLAAILRIKVQDEITRFLTRAAAILGVAGAFTLYYIFFQLPAVATDKAKMILEQNLKQQLSSLAAQEVDIEVAKTQAHAAIDKFNSTRDDLQKAATSAASKETDLQNNLDALDASKSKLIQRAKDLTDQLTDAEPKIKSLNSTEVADALRQINGTNGNVLKTFMKGLPRDALVLTTGVCPTGWKEEKSAQGALFVGVDTKKDPSSNALVLKAENIPNLGVAGSTTPATVTLGMPTALRDGNPQAGGTVSLESCKDKKCTSKPLVTTQVNVAMPAMSFLASAGSEKAKPVRNLYTVRVCKLSG